MGGIEKGEGGGGGTTTEARMKSTTTREENEVFKSWEWEGRVVNHTVFVRGEVRFVFYFS